MTRCVIYVRVLVIILIKVNSLTLTNTPDSKSKTEAMYFPAHSKPIEEVDKDLISGRIIISGNKFVDFTDKFKYLGTYLAQNLLDDTGVDDRITAASKNFNALGKDLFRNSKIALLIRCCLFVATTTNIILWDVIPRPSAAPKSTKLKSSTAAVSAR